MISVIPRLDRGISGGRNELSNMALSTAFHKNPILVLKALHIAQGTARATGLRSRDQVAG